MSVIKGVDWQPEQPYIISHGEFKLIDEAKALLGWPMIVDTSKGVNGVDTTDENKIWIKPFDGADPQARCVGVSITNRLEKDNAYQERAGLGGYRRDLRLLQYGLVPMLNLNDDATNGKVEFGDRVIMKYVAASGSEPEKIGFEKYVVDETAVPDTENGRPFGVCWQADTTEGQFGLVFIDPKVQGDYLRQD